MTMHLDSIPGEPSLVLPPKARRWSRLTRWAKIGAGVVGVLYLAQLGLLYTAQDQLLFPGASTRGKANVKPQPGSELVSLKTASGETIAALFGTALTPDGEPVKDPRNAPTLLYFYGNGTCLKTSTDQLEEFRRSGANVLIAEYVGYGMSTGRPSEDGCYATADAAYDYLRSRPDVDPARIVAAGGSLGGAVAIDLAARKPVAGLITFMTFTSLTDVAANHFPLVPVSLLRYRFDSVSKIRQVHCPILLTHGTSDLLVPHRMMDRLASAAGSPATCILVPSATHYNLFNVGAQPIADGLRKFLARI